MNEFKVERIKDSAQGLCGLLDIVFQYSVLEGLFDDNNDGIIITPDTLCKLIQSAKLLAEQLNHDTENLQEHVINGRYLSKE